jgi:transcriptional regulator GlxA family with amidase domain
MTRVVFLLVPDLHLLELAGPAQVFSTAADLGHPYTLHHVAEVPRVATVQGIHLEADLDWPTLTREDLVLVPGWRGPSRMISSRTARRLSDHHAAGGTVASVCAGVDALGRAGLLDGRRCTTHHALRIELARRYPATTVVGDVLYVADDRVVTCAGVASATDLALYLVGVQHGPGAAAAVARALMVYARRAGDDTQHSAMVRHRAHADDVVHTVQDVLDARYAERLPLRELAAAAGCSERNLTRIFQRATGSTPLAYQQVLRLEHAENLIGHGATVEAAARQVGFRDARMLRLLRAR